MEEQKSARADGRVVRNIDMLKELIKIANDLDLKGLTIEADKLDFVINKIAQESYDNAPDSHMSDSTPLTNDQLIDELKNYRMSYNSSSDKGHWGGVIAELFRRANVFYLKDITPRMIRAGFNQSDITDLTPYILNGIKSDGHPDMPAE